MTNKPGISAAICFLKYLARSNSSVVLYRLTFLSFVFPRGLEKSRMFTEKFLRLCPQPDFCDLINFVFKPVEP